MTARYPVGERSQFADKPAAEHGVAIERRLIAIDKAEARLNGSLPFAELVTAFVADCHARPPSPVASWTAATTTQHCVVSGS